MPYPSPASVTTAYLSEIANYFSLDRAASGRDWDMFGWLFVVFLPCGGATVVETIPSEIAEIATSLCSLALLRSLLPPACRLKPQAVVRLHRDAGHEPRRAEK
jgi:hypothetical protein